MFWKLIKFGYDKEHGLWNSTTRFYDEEQALNAFRDVEFGGENEDAVLLEIRSDGHWDIAARGRAMEEPGLMVTDKGLGVQIVERDPMFPDYYQQWIELNV